MTQEGFVGLMLILLVLMGWRMLFQLSRIREKTGNADLCVRRIEEEVDLIRRNLTEEFKSLRRGM